MKEERTTNDNDSNNPKMARVKCQVEHIVSHVWARNKGWRIAMIPFVLFVILSTVLQQYLIATIQLILLVDCMAFTAAKPSRKHWVYAIVPCGGFVAFFRKG